jgi:ATP-dependent helicase/nuclease subunit A
MEFNEKQKSVIFHKPDNNILVSAAAGSGKTSVLVWRIINLILNDKENDYTLSDFLVMTFTIKAAGEMKARIKSALDEMLFEDPQNEKLIRESSIIQNANISTIDSFCKKILEENYTMLDDSNSLYGNFDPAYRVLDGKEMDVLYDDVIERFFENKYDDANYYKLFEAYTKKASDKDLREMCVKGLKFLGSIPFADEYLNNKIVLYDKDSEMA